MKEALDKDPIKKKQIQDKRKEYFNTYMNSKYSKTIEYREKQKIKRNTPASNKKRSEHIRNKKNEDPLYRMKCNIRSLLSISMNNQGFKKNSRAHTILGCSYEEFKVWIENRFIDGMTWENYGMWEYDHVIPIDSALTEEECIKLNHYTNFQPLWGKDNRKKSNKI